MLSDVPAMPRLTATQWREARALREAGGASFPALAKRFGCSHQAIQKRAKAEKWAGQKTQTQTQTRPP